MRASVSIKQTSKHLVRLVFTIFPPNERTQEIQLASSDSADSSFCFCIIISDGFRSPPTGQCLPFDFGKRTPKDQNSVNFSLRKKKNRSPPTNWVSVDCRVKYIQLKPRLNTLFHGYYYTKWIFFVDKQTNTIMGSFKSFIFKCKYQTMSLGHTFGSVSFFLHALSQSFQSLFNFFDVFFIGN